MTASTETEQLPELHHVTATVGKPLSIIAKSLDRGPVEPGSMQLKDYDPESLRIHSFGWFPKGELKDVPVLRVIFLPLQAGQTEVRFQFRLDVTNPEYYSPTYIVTVEEA
jgi:hypothetical protein